MTLRTTWTKNNLIFSTAYTTHNVRWCVEGNAWTCISVHCSIMDKNIRSAKMPNRDVAQLSWLGVFSSVNHFQFNWWMIVEGKHVNGQLNTNSIGNNNSNENVGRVGVIARMEIGDVVSKAQRTYSLIHIHSNGTQSGILVHARALCCVSKQRTIERDCGS